MHMINALRSLSSADPAQQKEAEQYMAKSLKHPATHYPAVCAALTTILTRDSKGDEEVPVDDGVDLKTIGPIFMSTCNQLIDALEDENDLYKVACKTSEAIPMALVGLTYQEVSDLTGDGNSVSTISGTLIEKILQFSGIEGTRSALEVLVKFVSQTRLEGESWREREAALIVFGCICESVEEETIISNLVSTHYPNIVAKQMVDSHPMVVDTATWDICILFDKQYTRLWKDHPETSKAALELVLTRLKKDKPGKVLERPLQVLMNLAMSCATNMLDEDDGARQATNALSPYFERAAIACIQQFNAISDIQRVQGKGSPDGPETTADSLLRIQNIAAEVLSILIDASAKDCAPHLLKVLESVLSILVEPTNTTPVMVGMLCATLPPLCSKLGANVEIAAPALVNIVCSAVDAGIPTGLIDGHLGDMLLSLGALLEIDGSASLVDIAMKTVTPLIIAIPTKGPNYGQACAGFLSSVASALMDDFGPHAASVMPNLLEILKDSDEVLEEMEIVLPMFECVGDIMLHCGESSSLSPFKPAIKELFNDVLSNEDADEELVELLESVLEVL